MFSSLAFSERPFCDQTILLAGVAELSGIASKTSVGVGIMSQIVFGSGWLGINVVGNISTLVNTFLGGGVTGLITLIVLLGLMDNK